MQKSGTGRMQGVHYAYGSVTEMEKKEYENYIIPESVRLVYHDEPLLPTQFDAHGNPQIGGLADLMLIWKTRRMVHRGQLSSQYSMMVNYSYEVTSHPIEIPITQRLPRADVCPICGKPFTVSDLEEMRITDIDRHNAIAHKSCAKEFYHAQMIDEVAERVGLAFDSYEIDKENRFSWGYGERQMSYELIPNEYCSGSCCAHRPWFLFHTPIGDMKIGWRKRVINITFMENFAPFDMEIFAQENVTKDVEGDRRTIHAWGYEKLYEYLNLVRKTVLPNKPKS